MVYHVLNKSIAGFKIFNNDSEYSRMISAISYYQREKPSLKFCNFIKLNKEQRKNEIQLLGRKEKIAAIIAYCIMPTHLHLILKELKEKGISIFMKNALDSYTRYFNIKHNRKGPLWEGVFKRVMIDTDEQLLHVIRYIHLNPVTAYLLDKPEEWPYSSYQEYISTIPDERIICEYKGLLEIDRQEHKKFTKEGIAYQRQQKEAAKAEQLILE